MKTRYSLLFLSFFLLILGGCSQGVNSGKNELNNEKQTDNVESPELKAEVVQLYYVDDQALELLETKKEIMFQDDLDKYNRTYQALTDSSDEDMVVLWEEEYLKTVTFKEGLLTFSFETTGEAYGSSAERLQVLSLLQTMFQFEEVKQIQINHGENESLNGHMDITEPFTRDELVDL